MTSSSATAATVPVPRPFVVSFPAQQAERMMSLVETTVLPEEPPFPSANWEHGVHLTWLTQIRQQWMNTFALDAFVRKLNMHDNFMVNFPEETIDLHFVHARSNSSSAVPLLLLHGWPGSFLDFHKVIDPLCHPSGGSVAFNVVVPSLPGFGFSTYPSRTPFTFVDIGKLLHRLMTEVLGYDDYVVQGGDWGGFIARSMLASPEIAQSIPVAHMNMYFGIPTSAKIIQGLQTAFYPLFFIPGFKRLTDYIGERIQAAVLTPVERRSITRSLAYSESGTGYVMLQSTRPLSVGYALNDSPIGLLAYIGEKLHEWSDPTTMSNEDIINTVALYYLTRSFYTSVMIYNQSKSVTWDIVENPNKWKFANAKTKFGFSNYPYEIGAAPRPLFRGIANLVQYKEHRRGGHFPALDNSSDFISDLRELVDEHWEDSSRRVIRSR